MNMQIRTTRRTQSLTIHSTQPTEEHNGQHTATSPTTKAPLGEYRR